jgi:tetratricopeptide (TPR) repeat protein
MWLYRGLYGIDRDQDATLSSFEKALELAPNKADILWLRGFTLGSWGRWDEALADMTKARALLGDSDLISPAARDWFVASVYLAKGDRAAYQDACRHALDKIPSEPDADERGILLWMCTVTPFSVGESTQLADFAEDVLRPNHDAPTRDQLLAVGASLFRAGRLPEARVRLQQTLQQVADGKPTVDPMSEVFAHLFLAMTDSKLGSAEQAQASFAEATRLSGRIQPPCWVSKLQHKLLTDETRAILSSSRETLTDKNLRRSRNQ